MKTGKQIITITLIILTALSSCTTVKKNGYVQTRKYKTKKISLFHSKKQSNEKVAKSIDSSTKQKKSEKIEPNQKESQTLQINSIPSKAIQTIVDHSTESFAIKNTTLLTKTKLVSVKEFKKVYKKSISSILPIHKPAAKMDGTQMHWGAVAGFISAILSYVVAGLILGICAVIFCGIALKKIREEPDTYSGRGLAIAGLILGIIAVFLSLIYISSL